MSAGNQEHLAMGVAGGGGLVCVPLLQRNGDLGGVGRGRKLRVMLHGGDEGVNPPLGSSWVKPFTSSSVKWNALLKEIYWLFENCW